MRIAARIGVTLVAAAMIGGCLGPRSCGEGGRRDALAPSAARPVKAAFATAALPEDPDDPAVWRHPDDPSRSLIIGTVKVPAPDGAIAVFGLDGQIRQLITGIDRPNNVDVEYGLQLAGERVDIAVATERLKRQLRVFRIDASSGQLVDLGGLPVLEGQAEEGGAPMGIALYRRPRDQAIFAIIAPKTGPTTGYLWQYRLVDRGGRIAAEFVRRLGNFSAATVRSENEIEAVAVDDELGYVYYSDEADGVHKWHADPDHPGAGAELAHFARTGFRGDREGIAIYTRPGGTGYIVVTDQLESDSEYHVYAREGAPGNPHDHSHDIAVLHGGADSTDGLEVFSGPLGPRLPQGAMVAMNSSARNFLVYRWEDVASAVEGSVRTAGTR